MLRFVRTVPIQVGSPEAEQYAVLRAALGRRCAAAVWGVCDESLTVHRQMDEVGRKVTIPDRIGRMQNQYRSAEAEKKNGQRIDP